MMRAFVLSLLGFCLLTASCGAQGKPARAENRPAEDTVKLVILDPGHYHAALVQKSMYQQVDPAVHVYAPDGPDVQDYLKQIAQFNSRAQDPTRWQMKVHVGNDFLERMLAEKSGDIVVLSGNNRRKAEYIKASIDAGFNIFCDKPMCIDAQGFKLLEQAFASARQKKVLLFDIMTERYNATCILQKLLVLDRELFGEQQAGSAADPGVVKESVHHFFKYVAGSPIRRPAWYFDTTQQGEGLVDVTTHLIDLAMWTCFPDEAIDYRKDVVMEEARRWPTMITREQYEKVTGLPDFPGFLKTKLNDDGVLPCYSNGDMTFTLKGVCVKLSVTWNFEAPQGGGDTHHSLFRGSKANVIIRQGKEQNYKPEVYVEPAAGADPEKLASALKRAVARLQSQFPGLKAELLRGEGILPLFSTAGKPVLSVVEGIPAGRKAGTASPPSSLIPRPSWHVIIPEECHIGHEAHFQKVLEAYLQYLAKGRLPDWEVPNMLAKYYITTQALDMAK